TVDGRDEVRFAPRPAYWLRPTENALRVLGWQLIVQFGMLQAQVARDDWLNLARLARGMDRDQVTQLDDGTLIFPYRDDDGKCIIALAVPEDEVGANFLPLYPWSGPHPGATGE